MNVLFGLTVFILIAAGIPAASKLRAHIARLTTVIARQEADLLTCVEAQRHLSLALDAYSGAFKELAAKLSPATAEVLHALNVRLARQSTTLAQTLSHWDGRSDPRTLVAAEWDADIEHQLRALDDTVLDQLWHTRRPGDVAQMVWHLISLGTGERSAVEAQLRRTGRLDRELATEDVIAAWQRPASTKEQGHG